MKILLLLALSLLGVVLGSGDDLSSQVDLLQREMVTLSRRQREFERFVETAVLLYEFECPEGWEVADHLEGRYLLLSQNRVGQISEHTVDHPPTTLESECQKATPIRDDGGIPACREMPVKFNSTQHIPTAPLVPCKKSSD